MPFEKNVRPKPAPDSSPDFEDPTPDISCVDFYRQKLKEKGISEKEFLEMQMLIQEEEKIRIGQELHDGVNSLLAIAKLYIDCIRVKSPKDESLRKQALSTVMSAINNIRILSSELVVSQKKGACILELINDLVLKIKILGLFDISFKHNRAADLEKICPQRRLMLFRILQEQLNNIIRHSGAKNVKIELSCRNKEIMLVISDDGVGFDISRTALGTGMSNIYGRINQYNGVMEMESNAGKGCMLKVLLPLRD